MIMFIIFCFLQSLKSFRQRLTKEPATYLMLLFQLEKHDHSNYIVVCLLTL